MRVFAILRVTPGRLLAAVTAAVCLILTADAVRMAQKEPPVLLANDYDRALYLKASGLEVDPTPVWQKEIFLADPPDGETAAYLSMLEEQGYRPQEHLGRPLTVTCYRSLQDESLFARVLTDGDELVGADRFYATPDADPYLPLLPC